MLADPKELRTFTASVFEKMGCSDAHAALASDVLLMADLRGIDSHGVARLSGYIRLWEKGRIKTNPAMHMEVDRETTGTLDAGQSLGLISAPYAMDIAIEKAKKYGCGFVAIKNSNHFGIAAYHAMKALEHDMIGIAMTNASPLVAPTFSTERMLGTNPVCYAFPAGRHQPVVIDMATSAAANGKLEIAQRKGASVPMGWVQTKEGSDTSDASGLSSGGSLLPLGSRHQTGSHKGYAMASMVDIFCGVLSGANYGPWVPPFVAFLDPLPDQPGQGIGHFVGAIKIDGFRKAEDFKKNIDQWIDAFKAAKPVDEEQPVVIPGEPEFAFEKQRLSEGIPLNEKVVEDLETIGKKFGIVLKLKT
jgi:LDH2 family malate/lactate/ureidoglycolate dehydrogenase